jgi:hypothetical protein
MVNRIIIGLIVVLAIIQGLAADAIPMGIVPLVLVLLGLVYGGMAVDAEDATAYLVVALAVGAAGDANVLSNIQGIGASLDAIVDPISTALYAGVIAILVTKAANLIKG